MKNLNIKKLTNLFKRRDKNYVSEFDTTEIESNILIGSCPNIPSDYSIIDTTNISSVMSHIVIIFSIDKSYLTNEMIDKIEDFANSCKKSSILIRLYEEKPNNTYHIIVSSSHNNFASLIRKAPKSDDFFINEIDVYLSNFESNMHDYTGEEISYELVELRKHRSFRRAYDKYILEQHTSPIEILGYTWVTIHEHTMALSEYINVLWICVHESIQNQFISMRANSYRDEHSKRVFMKIPIIEFIEEMNSNISSIEEETFMRIKNIFESDIDYFKYIYNSINWSKYQYSANVYNVTDEDNTDDEVEESSQEEFINELIDEVIK